MMGMIPRPIATGACFVAVFVATHGGVWRGGRRGGGRRVRLPARVGSTQTHAPVCPESVRPALLWPRRGYRLAHRSATLGALARFSKKVENCTDRLIVNPGTTTLACKGRIGVRARSVARTSHTAQTRVDSHHGPETATARCPRPASRDSTRWLARGPCCRIAMRGALRMGDAHLCHRVRDAAGLAHARGRATKQHR